MQYVLIDQRTVAFHFPVLVFSQNVFFTVSFLVDFAIFWYVVATLPFTILAYSYFDTSIIFAILLANIIIDDSEFNVTWQYSMLKFNVVLQYCT